MSATNLKKEIIRKAFLIEKYKIGETFKKLKFENVKLFSVVDLKMTLIFKNKNWKLTVEDIITKILLDHGWESSEICSAFNTFRTACLELL